MSTRRTSLPRLVAVALGALLAVASPRAPLVAQSLTGTVTRADGASGTTASGTTASGTTASGTTASGTTASGTTASGVIVLMLTERRDSVLARTTSGPDGRFLLRVTQNRRVWLQLLRIGQRPQLDGPHAVSTTTTTTVRVVLNDAPLQLAAVNVRDNARCVVRHDSASTVAQLYEEARKALLSSSITTDARNMTARFVTFTRHEDLRGRQLTPIQRVTETRETSRPFTSLTADSLARIGYVYAVDDGTVYRAPDADVLMSERFVNTHCFQLVNGTQDRADYVGVGFRPVGATKERVGIRGTMWLDRTRSVLESVEFSYDPLAPDLTRARVGGIVEFARTPTNVWFVKRWELRMPRHTRRRVSAVAQSTIPGETTQLLLDGLDVTGGEVHTLSVGTQTLFSADPSVVVAVDAPVAPAVEPPSAGSGASALALCAGIADTLGSIVGRVVDQTNYGVGDVRVTATWKERFRQAGDMWSWGTRTLATTSALGGGYALCGIPLATTIAVDATPANSKSTAHQASLELTPQARHLTRDLPVRIVVAQATFTTDAQPAGSPTDDDLPPRLKAFDKRAAARGAGSYITRDDIIKRRANTVQQLLRSMGGISIVTDGNGVRRAISTRGRIMTRGSVKACELPIVIDHTEASGLDVLDGLRPSDLYGIEVYFGPASIPNEFMALANGAWCGMIGVWTISG